MIAQPRIVELPAFTVDLELRLAPTTRKEAGADGIIGKLWYRFMSDQLLEKIPGKVSPEIYGVYTDYASDANDDYTLILGARVQGSADDPPTGMVKTVVPQSSFAVFSSERGPVAKVVVETWQHILSYFQSRKERKACLPGGFRAVRPTRGRPRQCTGRHLHRAEVGFA